MTLTFILQQQRNTDFEKKNQLPLSIQGKTLLTSSCITGDKISKTEVQPRMDNSETYVTLGTRYRTKTNETTTTTTTTTTTKRNKDN